MALDSTKIARIADGVNALSRRFDAIARKDAAVPPSEYKKLVAERDKAKKELAAAYERAGRGEKGLKFRNLEAEYTRASQALASAQMKMSK